MEVEPENDDPEAVEERRLKAEAEAQKAAGSDAYRKRDFATAAAAYEKAWEIWPKDVTFLTNLSGAYSEVALSHDAKLWLQPLNSNKAITISVSKLV